MLEKRQTFPFHYLLQVWDLGVFRTNLFLYRASNYFQSPSSSHLNLPSSISQSPSISVSLFTFLCTFFLKSFSIVLDVTKLLFVLSQVEINTQLIPTTTLLISCSISVMTFFSWFLLSLIIYNQGLLGVLTVAFRLASYIVFYLSTRSKVVN